ncbi:MAG TPA: hypothetical protein VF860_10415 [Candidatus Acidoferrales bacterium]
MRREIIASSLLAILLLSPCGSVQQSAAAQQTPPVLQGALNALTGGTAVADVTLAGTARRIAGSDNETGTATLKALATGESRMDLSFASGPRSEVRASSSAAADAAGSWSAADGVWHPIANHNLFADSSWFFPALTIGRLASSASYVLSYVGQETRNGQAVVHVTASQQFTGIPAAQAPLFQHLSQMDIFLDAATLLPAALLFNTHPDNDAGLDIPIEIRFSDYRAVNGVHTPFHVQKYLNNGLVLDLHINTVNLNTGLSAAAFSVP